MICFFFFFFRYYEKYPKTPHHPIPRINLDHLECENSSYSQKNSSGAHQLDASRFFAPSLPGKSIRGPTFHSRDVDEEYRFLIPSELFYPPEFTFSFTEFLNHSDFQLLNVLFLVLDILLIVYRCSRTYTTASTLCQGFKDTTSIRAELQYDKDSNAKVSELQNLRNHIKHNGPTAAHEYYDHEVNPHRASPRGILQPNNAPLSNDMSQQRLPIHTENIKKRSCLDKMIAHIGEIVMSNVVPKLLICAVIITFFYFMVTVALATFSVDVLIDVDGFRSFLMGLGVQANQTNWYLTQQATHFNDITMEIYQRQMQSELLNLESMLEFFNQGKIFGNKKYYN